VIAWILSSGRVPYVAAVLQDQAAAVRYLAELPAPVRERSAVGARADLAFPCYLAEDSAGLRPLSASEAEAYVAGLGRGTPNADGVYGNLYRLDGEFSPKVAGRDEMGRLPHLHLEARDLAYAARAGVAALWGHRSDAETPGV
jgi:hypothetical protein